MKKILSMAFLITLAIALSFIPVSGQSSATIFAQDTGTPGTYYASSEIVVSPEMWRDYYAEGAWVSNISPVTLTVADGGAFEIRISSPTDAADLDWTEVNGSYTFTPHETGRWRMTFGRIGLGFFLIDFHSVSTNPPVKLIPFIRENVNYTVAANMLTEEDAKPLVRMLNQAQKQINSGNNMAEIHTLNAFVGLVNEYVDLDLIPWAKGQLWINAAKFIINRLG